MTNPNEFGVETVIGLLRHGQTGTILIHRATRDAVVIPQRATFDILAKRYAGAHTAPAKCAARLICVPEKAFVVGGCGG